MGSLCKDFGEYDSVFVLLEECGDGCPSEPADLNVSLVGVEICET
jgi:hypothetical protein